MSGTLHFPQRFAGEPCGTNFQATNADQGSARARTRSHSELVRFGLLVFGGLGGSGNKKPPEPTQRVRGVEVTLPTGPG